MTILAAVLGPVLGAVADMKGFKKPVFACFMGAGALGCAALSLPVGWMAFLGIYVFAKVGYQGSLTFYDSMLADVTTEDRVDQISSHGYAWGYIGSCIPFILSILCGPWGQPRNDGGIPAECAVVVSYDSTPSEKF